MARAIPSTGAAALAAEGGGRYRPPVPGSVPMRLPVSVLACLPSLSLLGLGIGSHELGLRLVEAQPGRLEDSSPLLLARLQSEAGQMWMRLKRPASVEQLAAALGEDETRLARLNRVNEDHQFVGGDWLALPAERSRQAARSGFLDIGSERTEAPPASEQQTAAGAGVSMGVIQAGDSIDSLARRYGLRADALRELNPGLDSSTLVAGSQVRLARWRPNTPSLRLPVAGGDGVSVASLPRQLPALPALPPLPDLPQNPDRFLPPGHSMVGWVWPADGEFTSGYGWRWGKMHKGIDVANAVGTPIRAAFGGRVTYAGWNDFGYGYLVEITHPDGSTSLYAHNSRILVLLGDEVQTGQLISEMGSTGRSTGPHLHFEVHPVGRGAINPLEVLPQRA